MKRLSLLASVAVLLVSVAPASADPSLVVSLRGKRQYVKVVGADTKAFSETVSFTSVCADFGLDPRKYVLVFDKGAFALLLVPKNATPALPTKTLVQFKAQLSNYIATKPVQWIAFTSITSGGGTAGTPFDSLSGNWTVLLKAKTDAMNGTPTGVAGNLTASANGAGATPTYPLYVLSFSGTKAFVQGP
jgi:hypothetical protein